MARSNDRAPRHADLHRPIRQFDEADIPALLKDVKDPLILVLDGVQDPHNLGACIRNADCAGCTFVVITRKNSAPVTDTVRLVAVGAAETMPIVQVNNLRNALVKLKDAGVWLAGTSDHKASQSLYAAKLTGPLAIVLGAEGDGIRHLTAETCDFLLRIPMLGQVPCLNVSVSAGVCLFEALRQRGHR
ncbi:MAG: 23S rRNA (guanosine(2251)-2'-O)-methyltransferase RlmB [Verrucomicrobia bacterium]|nr:23S rRNA (guanosine(2251)-2'-O)-methyltransferase RlmB [Verrucomicrobiota bacterium]